MSILIIWLLTILTFFIGYFVGYTKVSPEEVKKLVSKISFKKNRLGVVRRLTNQEKLKKGTKLEETEQAMEETLDNML